MVLGDADLTTEDLQLRNTVRGDVVPQFSFLICDGGCGWLT